MIGRSIAHYVVESPLGQGGMGTPSGQVKVLDFGLAKAITPENESDVVPTRRMETMGLSTPGLIMGTVGYMSPEQIQGKSVDARSDVFAMGVLMFEILCGRRPFAGDSKWDIMSATVAGKAPSLLSLRPETPPALAHIIERCLRPDPSERYASGDELFQDLNQLTVTATDGKHVRRSRVMAFAGVGFGLLAILLTIVLITRESRRRWATETALAEIDSLRAQDDLVGAYRVARKAFEIAPTSSAVAQAWANLGVLCPNLTSDPPGAEIAFQRYTPSDREWTVLGATPLRNVRAPWGLLRWRLTKPGYDTLLVGQSAESVAFRLVASESSRTGMVLVPRGTFTAEFLPNEAALPDFWLDKYEVTNREYKAFVDAGGYRDQKYWREPFVRGTARLTWDESMPLFHDTTGRPGPVNWELGNYPEGQADDPVGGVSWFEAARTPGLRENSSPLSITGIGLQGRSVPFPRSSTPATSEAKDRSRWGGRGELVRSAHMTWPET